MNRRTLLKSAVALAAGRAWGAGKVPEGVVHIPSGSFIMGSTRPGRGESQSSLHSVELSEFYIGKYLVTNAQYKEFTDAAGARFRPRYWDNAAFSWKEKADHPVLWVGYNQCSVYSEWLTKKTDWRVALPSDAQWERAARGVTKTGDENEFPWGNATGANDYRDRLNFNVLCATKNGAPKTIGGVDYPYWPFVLRVRGDSVTASNFKGVAYGEDEPGTPFDESSAEVRTVWKKIMDAGGYTTAVGTYPAGPSGCYDMAGNAFEWTRDFSTVSTYKQLAAKGLDPCVDSEAMLTEEDRKSGSDGARSGRATKIIRGGSWYANESSCRTHYRSETRAAGQAGYHSVGFRVVMTPLLS
jgi:formylglycine-generating enzyme required for sulfatase activity